MNSMYSDLIERYFLGTMSQEEFDAFQKLKLTNKEFSEELAQYELAMGALLEYKQDQLRQTLKTKETVIQTREQKQKYWLGAGILFLVISLFFYIAHIKNVGQTIQQQSTSPSLIDSLNYNENSQKSSDTLKVPDNSTPSEHKRKTEPGKKEKSKPDFGPEENSPIQSTDKLFAMNYRHYSDDDLKGVIRGNEDLSNPYVQFLTFYSEKNYAAALNMWDSLSTGMQQNDNNRFVKALCFLALDHDMEAQNLLESIIQNNKSRYVQAAQWYLALTYLKQNYKESCVKILNVILKFEDHQYFEVARNLNFELLKNK